MHQVNDTRVKQNEGRREADIFSRCGGRISCPSTSFSPLSTYFSLFFPPGQWNRR